MKSKIHKYNSNSFKIKSNKLFFLSIFLFVSFVLNAQVFNDSVVKKEVVIQGNDTIIPLDEVVVYKQKRMSPAEMYFSNAGKIAANSSRVLKPSLANMPRYSTLRRIWLNEISLT